MHDCSDSMARLATLTLMLALTAVASGECIFSVFDLIFLQGLRRQSPPLANLTASLFWTLRAASASLAHLKLKYIRLMMLTRRRALCGSNLRRGTSVVSANFLPRSDALQPSRAA